MGENLADYSLKRKGVPQEIEIHHLGTVIIYCTYTKQSNL